ncbi:MULTISPECIES: PilN domain-containing protein [unclassified Acinetobacter]|uniref:PilN domain-containing protein n=1 Tax=unclassified Acinetobacter TaxID=196816 RepID=UPI00190BA982|nr:MULTISPECIES: PilN domain-containing protein [unclassified Acinetobacter]MBK0062886.1 PilN domain-containing protein [Acinetobacter sp. S55]MBK0065537.1 PilN domain-containing protein [Acinetobacter sp. S54]
MAKINLLPWRDELREQRKKQFIAFSAAIAVLGVVAVVLAWLFYDHKLNDQEQANQLIVSTNQNLDTQLKSLDGLQERRNAIVERMKLIQGLEGQRPVTVRLIDELVRVTPSNMYLTKFTRAGDKFTIEGKAESPNTVAELLRNLEASPWYRNAFMNSFLAADDKKDQTQSSVVPRVEESYGTFVVTTDLGEIGAPVTEDNNNQQGSNTGAAQ